MRTQVNKLEKFAQKISWMLAKEEYTMHDTDKNKNKIFLIYEEIQKGSGAKS